MNESEPVLEPWQDWIDDYLHGVLDEARLRDLEERLRNDAEARRYFVRYARLDTDLHLEMRAHRAGTRALDHIVQITDAASAGDSRRRARRVRRIRSVLAIAASLVLAVGVSWWLAARPVIVEDQRTSVVAWLVNAQNCEWSGGTGPVGKMEAGNTLELERGLAEIRFDCGAKVVLEGPANLELLSAKSARLLNGKLTARVPEAAVGFEILSPQGKVIDLGTEFGVSVSGGGATTEVFVFEGKVEALSAKDGLQNSVSLTQNQSARIAAGKVTVQPNEADTNRFVRAIVPPKVMLPRTLSWTFDQPADGGIRDVNGLPIGLTYRLPGTGRLRPTHDPNLKLDTSRRQLELTTTNSDLNTQFRLNNGEYVGVRLADLGFTGEEDFAVTATILDIPALEFIGQFGLYAGSRSDNNIRGGLLSNNRKEPGQYAQFLTSNYNGKDVDPQKIGLLSTGSDLRLTLKRIAGKYSLTVENLTAGSASTLTIRHPEFLDKERDLFVGFFGANTQSDIRRTLIVKELQVTVWTLTKG